MFLPLTNPLRPMIPALKASTADQSASSALPSGGESFVNARTGETPAEGNEDEIEPEILEHWSEVKGAANAKTETDSGR